MSRIFYEQYNYDCYDREEIIKKYGRDIFESEDLGNPDGIADWMADKAELKRAYDWALESGFFDEEDFMEIGDDQWGGLLHVFHNKTKPQYDYIQSDHSKNPDGTMTSKHYMGYYDESYEDAKARHEAMDIMDLDEHYFTD